jgi:hypothetical protein
MRPRYRTRRLYRNEEGLQQDYEWNEDRCPQDSQWHREGVPQDRKRHEDGDPQDGERHQDRGQGRWPWDQGRRTADETEKVGDKIAGKPDPH